MKYLLSGLLILLCMSVISQEALQWRGEARDGKYNETGLLKKWPDAGPELLWHFDSLGVGHASAMVTKNFVYTAGTIEGKGFVIAFDHKGKEVWRTEYGKEWIENFEGVRTTPMIDNGKLYIISGYAKIVCMNPDDGKIIWSVDAMTDYEGRNIKWGITENLLINDNMLFCTLGGEEANVLALDKNTGKLIWKCAGNGEKSAYCSPILFNRGSKKILVTMTEKSILGIDAADGKLLWSHPKANKWSVHANSPLYHDGYLYCVDGYKAGGVMLEVSEDGTSIKEVWKNESHDNKMGGVVLVNGNIYGSGDGNRKWFCLDWKTGEEKYASEKMKPGNIIFADGSLYCYGIDGTIALVEPGDKDFNIISSFTVPYGEYQHWAHLVIANKKLYVRHGNSLMVYAIAE